MGDLDKMIGYVSDKSRVLGFTPKERGFIQDNFIQIAELPDGGKTAVHSVGVERRTDILGEMLGLDAKRSFVNGILHDVGKIMLPGELISFEGEFNKYQREQMKPHPALSQKILYPVFPDSSEDVLHHHSLRRDYPYPLPSKNAFKGNNGKLTYLHSIALALADHEEALNRTDREDSYEKKLKDFFNQYPYQHGMIKRLRGKLAA